MILISSYLRWFANGISKHKSRMHYGLHNVTFHGTIALMCYDDDALLYNQFRKILFPLYLLTLKSF